MRARLVTDKQAGQNVRHKARTGKDICKTIPDMQNFFLDMVKCSPQPVFALRLLPRCGILLQVIEQHGSDLFVAHGTEYSRNLIRSGVFRDDDGLLRSLCLLRQGQGLGLHTARERKSHEQNRCGRNFPTHEYSSMLYEQKAQTNQDNPEQDEAAVTTKPEKTLSLPRSSFQSL
jgi:hypothetical protein